MPSRLRMLAVWTPLIALAVTSAAAFAADEVKPGARAVAPATRGAAPSALPARLPATAEERALLDLQSEGERRVAELERATQGVPDGPALRALERKVEEVMLETWANTMRARAGFARRRGDLAAAHEIEATLERVLHPLPPAAPIARQTPDKAQAK